ncbi:hypothetical protein PINS_up023186 [Pythium insidiosum]|nr:hypothetical protein PINS_up023186 [Pythium insidiosum]
MRAARMRKYEAFHGTGRSLSGKSSTFSTIPTTGNRLGSASTSETDVNATKTEESKQEDTAVAAPGDAASSKPDFVPFQGSGRRLR